MWDLRKNDVLYKMSGHTDTVTCLRLSPDGSFILSNAMDNTGKYQSNYETNMLKKNRRNSFSIITLPTLSLTVYSIVVDAFFRKTSATISWLGPGFTVFIISLFSISSKYNIIVL